MNTKTRHDDDEPKAKAKAAPTTTEAEVNEDLSKVPYPTGSPPDPMEEYYKHSPERKPPEETEPEPEAASKKRK